MVQVGMFLGERGRGREGERERGREGERERGREGERERGRDQSLRTIPTP